MKDSVGGRRKKLFFLLMVFFGFVGFPVTGIELPNPFNWTQIELPFQQNQQNHPGLAGAFSGLSNDALIIAGGTNFPDLPPWKAGKKVWQDQILVLLKDGGNYKWVFDAHMKLSNSAANGVSITLQEGLLCVGGDGPSGILKDVFLLIWDQERSQIISTKLKPLPDGFEATGGALIAGYIYITGITGNHNSFIRIQSEKLLNNNDGVWESLPPCPGLPRKLMAYAAQNNGQYTNLYLFGGRSAVNRETTILYDSYEYDVKHNQWKHINENQELKAFMGASALSMGSSSILLFGGDDGELFLERIALEKAIEEESDLIIRDSLILTLEKSFVGHHGFSKRIAGFNTITRTFTAVGAVAELAPVVTQAILWDGKIWLPSGETFPGVRSPLVLIADPILSTGNFGGANYAVLGIYFAILISIGLYFSSRQNSTEDYFKGGGRIPWWAAGISIFGTALSAVTFMAIPAKTFATDWSYLLYNLTVLIVTPIVVMFFIPHFIKLNLVTAYEYLEQRYNLTVRWLGGFSFIIFQLGRIGIVLYLPAIALSLVTGIDIFTCIIAMGLISMFYTYIGGIEAVIWTDVIQVIVLMGGALLSIVLITVSLDQNVFSLIQEASEKEKFHVFNFRFNWAQPTFWVVIIGGFFANLVTYSSDQTMVQRYLTANNEKGAAKSSWTNAILVIPASLLFFSVGTALFLFYLKFPEKIDSFSKDNDAIFPWFIIQELPTGISGFLIAGIFSAAMSTLSSSMNSIAASFSADFYLRIKPDTDAKKSLQIAKLTTLFSGIVGTLLAIWMATSNITSLWDMFFKVLGLFTGGLGGLFLLGIFTKKANAQGAIIGMVASSFIQYLVVNFTDIHLFLYAGIGMSTCFIIGYLSSVLLKVK